MSRQPIGRVVEHHGRDGMTCRALRFTAYGSADSLARRAVSVDEAEQTLRHTMADVERGTWRPPRDVEPAVIPTFHQYAEDW